jgi:hypothetical protein
MEFIIDALRPHLEQVRGAGDADAVMAALAFETYNMVEEMLFETIDRQWMAAESKLVLLGGIMLNIDGDAPDMFIPLRFESHAPEGEVTDLMETAFGESASSFALSI